MQKGIEPCMLFFVEFRDSSLLRVCVYVEVPNAAGAYQDYQVLSMLQFLPKYTKFIPAQPADISLPGQVIVFQLNRS